MLNAAVSINGNLVRILCSKGNVYTLYLKDGMFYDKDNDKYYDSIDDFIKENFGGNVHVHIIGYYPARNEINSKVEQDNTEGIGTIVHDCWQMVHEKYPNAGEKEKFEKAWECMRNGIPSEHVEGMSELMRYCWAKAKELNFATKADEFAYVWQCVRGTNESKPDVLRRMREKGWTPKANPMCVISKEIKENIPKIEAEQQCIEEGKLHPINIIAFEERVKGE